MVATIRASDSSVAQAIADVLTTVSSADLSIVLQVTVLAVELPTISYVYEPAPAVAVDQREDVLSTGAVMGVAFGLLGGVVLIWLLFTFFVSGDMHLPHLSFRYPRSRKPFSGGVVVWARPGSSAQTSSEHKRAGDSYTNIMSSNPSPSDGLVADSSETMLDNQADPSQV